MRPPLALEAPPTYLALPAPHVVEVVSQPVSIISQMMKERDHGNMRVLHWLVCPSFEIKDLFVLTKISYWLLQMFAIVY